MTELSADALLENFEKIDGSGYKIKSKACCRLVISSCEYVVALCIVTCLIVIVVIGNCLFILLSFFFFTFNILDSSLIQ